MNIKALIEILVCCLLFGSAAAIAQDVRTKRCEVRPGCAVFLTEAGRCPQVASVEGGTCTDGLLQGTVVRRIPGGRPFIYRYRGGKVVGPFLSSPNIPSDSSGTMYFAFNDIDDFGRPTEEGRAQYGCRVDSNGVVIDADSVCAALVSRAIQWLGKSTVAAVVDGSWSSTNSATSVQGSNGSTGTIPNAASNGSDLWKKLPLEQCLAAKERIYNLFPSCGAIGGDKSVMRRCSKDNIQRLDALQSLYTGPCPPEMWGEAYKQESVANDIRSYERNRSDFQKGWRRTLQMLGEIPADVATPPSNNCHDRMPWLPLQTCQ